MRQKCVKNASNMRGTPLGKNTLWTILTVLHCPDVTCASAIAHCISCCEPLPTLELEPTARRLSASIHIG